MTWLAVRELRRQAGLPTKEVILANKNFTTSPSGGTVESIFNGLKIDPKIVAESHDPWFLSPVRGAPVQNPINSLGIRKDPRLGVLVASAYGARQDRAVVHRTWGLLQGGTEYGANFYFNEYDSASSTFQGVWKMLNAKLLGIFLLLGPLARVFLPKEGDGPDPETTRHTLTELEAVAVADWDSDKRALARLKFVGDSYHLSAAVLAQGAASLLYTRELQSGHKGGNLTPAILGEDFVERLEAAGAKFDIRLLL